MTYIVLFRDFVTDDTRLRLVLRTVRYCLLGKYPNWFVCCQTLFRECHREPYQNEVSAPFMHHVNNYYWLRLGSERTIEFDAPITTTLESNRRGKGIDVSGSLGTVILELIGETVKCRQPRLNAV